MRSESNLVPVLGTSPQDFLVLKATWRVPCSGVRLSQLICNVIPCHEEALVLHLFAEHMSTPNGFTERIHYFSLRSRWLVTHHALQSFGGIGFRSRGMLSLGGIYLPVNDARPWLLGNLLEATTGDRSDVSDISTCTLLEALFI